jgi:outer membrane protein assembly factor BamA
MSSVLDLLGELLLEWASNHHHRNPKQYLTNTLKTNILIFRIRKEAGDSILTSIKHTHTIGRLDNPVLPNEGYKLKLFQVTNPSSLIMTYLTYIVGN